MKLNYKPYVKGKDSSESHYPMSLKLPNINAWKT